MWKPKPTKDSDDPSVTRDDGPPGIVSAPVETLKEVAAGSSGSLLSGLMQNAVGSGPNGTDKTIAAMGVAGAVAAALAYALTLRFKVAKPHEYLVRTGAFIDNMAVSKKGVQWPFQEVRYIDMTPRNIQFHLACLSKQYLPFDMPVTFTVSPWDPLDPVAYELITSARDEHGHRVTSERKPIESDTIFKRYAAKMEALSDEDYYDTILGVVHGETRVLAARMEIDQINDDRDAFREQVAGSVQDVLMQYGVKVGNANIAELIEKNRDGEMGYLEARERRKLSDAVQQSEIDVAEAKRMGDVGKMEKVAETRQRVAVLEAETVRQENEQSQGVALSMAQLAEAEADASRRKEVAQIEAEQAAKLRQEELQLQVEEARREQERAAKQAVELTSAQVGKSTAIVEAEGQADAIRLVAHANRDAALAKAQGKQADLEAEAKGREFLLMAEARGKEASLMADARGQAALLEAQAEGTRQLVDACGPEALRDVLWVNNGIPQALAQAKAEAVQGMHPQIYSVSGDSAGSVVSKMVTGMAPVLDLVRNATSNSSGGGGGGDKKK